MAAPRIEQYARLLVETCVDVQPRWQVVISSSPSGLGRPHRQGPALGRVELVQADGAWRL